MSRRLACWMLFTAAACSADAPPPGLDTRSAALLSVPSQTLQTFINASLEIDQLNQGSGLGLTDPADANLFRGNDPADGTHSVPFPTGGPANFVDWNDLGGAGVIDDHRLLDGVVGNKDPTAFPTSNECVGTASVLSKMDLT